jgi:predicted aspartyl protease
VAPAILLAVALAATSFGEGPPPTGPAGDVSVRLEPYLGRLVTVSARLGQEPLRLLLDTGGGQTLITPQVAERLGCTPRGRSVGLRMTGERVEFRRCDAAPLEIGGRRLHGSEVAVWDVMAVLPKEVPPLDGVLALDRLAEQPFTLDLSGRTLTLESGASLERRVAGSGAPVSKLGAHPLYGPGNRFVVDRGTRTRSLS